MLEFSSHDVGKGIDNRMCSVQLMTVLIKRGVNHLISSRKLAIYTFVQLWNVSLLDKLFKVNATGVHQLQNSI